MIRFACLLSLILCSTTVFSQDTPRSIISKITTPLVDDVPLSTSSQKILNPLATHRQNATLKQIQTAYFLLGLEYQTEPTTTGKQVIDYYQQLTDEYRLDNEYKSQLFTKVSVHFNFITDKICHLFT